MGHRDNRSPALNGEGIPHARHERHSVAGVQKITVWTIRFDLFSDGHYATIACMDGRLTLTDEAEIQRVVRDFRWLAHETALRKATESWTPQRFLYAIDRLNVDLTADQRVEMLPMYRKLLEDCERRIAQAEAEEKASERHTEITANLRELKKPHWTVLPNFWLTFVSAVAALVAAVAAVLALNK